MELHYILIEIFSLIELTMLLNIMVYSSLAPVQLSSDATPICLHYLCLCLHYCVLCFLFTLLVFTLFVYIVCVYVCLH